MLAITIAVGIHVLCAIIWVGGMFFVHVALRPALTQSLEPPLQMQCWAQVFNRFFKWVWIAIILLLVSGAWITSVYGGMGTVGTHIHLMVGLGILMVMLFGHIFFASYRRFKQAVVRADFSEAGRYLKRIRWFMTANLVLGILVTLIAVTGRYLQL